MNVDTIAIPHPDDFYEAFCDAHKTLAAEDSAALNIRLIFLLANQIPDQGCLLACLKAAGETVP